VNPTSETVLIVLTTLVILLVLGAIIIYLHMEEKVILGIVLSLTKIEGRLERQRPIDPCIRLIVGSI